MAGACHQVRPDGFGGAKSFGGGFAVDTRAPLEQRQVFGPFRVAEGTAKIMRSATGFVPTEAKQLVAKPSATIDAAARPTRDSPVLNGPSCDLSLARL